MFVFAPALKAVADAAQSVRGISREPANRAHDQFHADATRPEALEAVAQLRVASGFQQRPDPGRLGMGLAQHRPRLALQGRLAGDLELDGVAHGDGDANPVGSIRPETVVSPEGGLPVAGNGEQAAPRPATVGEGAAKWPGSTADLRTFSSCPRQFGD